MVDSPMRDHQRCAALHHLGPKPPGLPFRNSVSTPEVASIKKSNTKVRLSTAPWPIAPAVDADQPAARTPVFLRQVSQGPCGSLSYKLLRVSFFVASRMASLGLKPGHRKRYYWPTVSLKQRHVLVTKSDMPSQVAQLVIWPPKRHPRRICPSVMLVKTGIRLANVDLPLPRTPHPNATIWQFDG